MSAQQPVPWTHLLVSHEQPILDRWIEEQLAAVTLREDLMSKSDLRAQSKQFLGLLVVSAGDGDTDVRGEQWSAVLDFLAELSRTRAAQGYTPTETATFVFSLKQPILAALQDERGDAPDLIAQSWAVNVLLDKLGLFTFESFQKKREEIIARQQVEMLELSTPVVQLWDGVLALPLIGTLDSGRTQTVMESLLQSIQATRSRMAIIDITGVPAVDTLVAQHLLKTVAATRLMGASCVVSGVRPQIAQTMVHLGVSLEGVTTKATLADALAHAFRELGLTVTSSPRA